MKKGFKDISKYKGDIIFPVMIGIFKGLIINIFVKLNDFYIETFFLMDEYSIEYISIMIIIIIVKKYKT